MEILVIIEEEIRARSSFLYSKIDSKKTLVQFSPEFVTEHSSLGTIYETQGVSGIRTFFEEEFQWHLDGYIRFKLEDLTWAVEKIIPEGIQFHGGTLSPTELQEKMSYRVDENGEFSVFHRQRALLKSIVKTVGKKQNIFKVPQYLNLLSKVSETNLNNSQFFALLKNYSSLQEAPSTKLVIPLPDTYEVQTQNGKEKVIMTDSVLNKELLKNLAKDS